MTDPKNPVIFLNDTSVLTVMEGSEITSIAVDQDQSILYVSDTNEKKIKNLKYAPEMLTIINSEIGLENVLYSGLNNMGHISSIEVDLLGDMYWSYDKYGKENGVVAKAAADAPGEDTIEVQSKALESARGLDYKNQFLFFIGEDTNDSSKDAVYYKNIPLSGEVHQVVNKVAGGFDNLVSVASYDEFIYVADGETGIFAIEAYQDGSFSEPRQFNLEMRGRLDENAPAPTQMVIVALGGLNGLYLSVTLLMCLVALNLF